MKTFTKYIKLFFITVLSLSFTGCASVKISNVGGKCVAVTENTGWYLFNFIPIASGDVSNPNGYTCSLFQNSVNLKNSMELLEYAMKKENAFSCKDIVSYSTDEKVFILLLKRLSYHTSAELIKEPAKGKTE
jgi:hypothetical protein